MYMYYCISLIVTVETDQQQLTLSPSFSFQDPGGQQVGFLLNSLNVSVAITSELTSKHLPKEEGKDHISHCKGM